MDYHVVAFMDVLGFSRMVESDSKQDQPIFLPIFRDILDGVKLGFTDLEGLDVKMFSDSVVVSAPFSPHNISRVFIACAQLQCRFLAQGILLRGGISFGKHYSDELVIYSEGMISAYYIESRRAKFPRIVIDDNLFDLLTNHPDLTDDLKSDCLNVAAKDPDGALFINYLRIGNFEALTDKIKDLFSQSRLAEDSVMEKMRWLHDYHSYCAGLLSRKDLLLDDFKSGFSIAL